MRIPRVKKMMIGVAGSSLLLAACATQPTTTTMPVGTTATMVNPAPATTTSAAPTATMTAVDRQRADEVARVLNRDAELRNQRMQVSALGHTVFLEGEVATMHLEARAIAAAREVSGVNRVISSLRVAGQPMIGTTTMGVTPVAGVQSAHVMSIDRPTVFAGQAAAGTATMTRRERQRADDIARSMRDGRALRNEPISIRVVGDTAYLEGYVRTEENRAIALATASVPGVGRIVDNLMVGDRTMAHHQVVQPQLHTTTGVHANGSLQVTGPTVYGTLPAGAAVHGTVMTARDREAAERITRTMRDQRDLRDAPITVRVMGDTVYLEGHVADERVRSAAIASAGGHAGVNTIVNRIHVSGQPAITYAPGTVVAPHVTHQTWVTPPTYANGAVTFNQPTVAMDAMGTTTMTATERQYADQIVRQMRDHHDLREMPITVRVSGNTVFLEGEVRTEYQRNAAIGSAAGIPGVNHIVNNLRVTAPVGTVAPFATGTLGFPDPAGPRVVTLGTEPFGPTDEAIVMRVVRNMAQNTELRDQRIMVLYANGTVTLEGEIASKSQEVLAIAAASGVDGVRNVVSNLRVTDWANPPGTRR
jgi:osmotically-inducible protein OsmY